METICIEYKSSTPMTEVWKKVRNFTGVSTCQEINVLKVNNMNITDKKEIAETLANIYSQNSCSTNYEESFLSKKRDEEALEIPTVIASEDSSNMPISIEEYNDALSSFKIVDQVSTRYQ
ncbi:hypothetical protein JTB14_033090 [Gonioctena quinquepunctata]|nr:hypothetical protein JTB14_033090 [Gonioctena quinquepunctata]